MSIDVSLYIVKHRDVIRRRDKLAANLPTAELLRGSLLQRTVRHKSGCPKCERGEGHPVLVLAVSEPGGKVRHISLRPRQPWDRIGILARARRDCRLCHAAAPGGRRFYSAEQFTPDQIRQRESMSRQHAGIFHGGQWREVRYKEVASVYWRCGGAKRPLRLLVVAPVPYDSGKGKLKQSGGKFAAAEQLKTALQCDPPEDLARKIRRMLDAL